MNASESYARLARAFSSDNAFVEFLVFLTAKRKENPSHNEHDEKHMQFAHSELGCE